MSSKQEYPCRRYLFSDMSSSEKLPLRNDSSFYITRANMETTVAAQKYPLFVIFIKTLLNHNYSLDAGIK